MVACQRALERTAQKMEGEVVCAKSLGPSQPWDGVVELSLLVNQSHFPPTKQNVRVGHFSSLGALDDHCVPINSMPSILPGPWVNK